MNVIAINGSPRKRWNTATLLEKALEGAASKGAATEMVHLYDLNYKGCTSCFSCKLKNGESYGKCAMKDDLTPLLSRIATVDGLLLGTPIYVGTGTGEMRSFLERLVFPNLAYTNPPTSLFPRKLRVGLIFTFGATAEQASLMGFDKHVAMTQGLMARIFGEAASVCSYDTLQFDDYEKYFAPRFDPSQKLARRREVFPQDCDEAFAMGTRLIAGV
ncbi:MAG: flavodoxin family protein [Candidatus Riflebacteria bacterium]|nr:flavodoxin family protein [Candidatus Riflebacteria bacterium]